jgi:hypothetical protein
MSGSPANNVALYSQFQNGYKTGNDNAFHVQPDIRHTTYPK